MQDAAFPKFIAPMAVCMAVLAVICAGFGGLYEGQRIQILWAAGSVFCHLMLMVLSILASGWITERMSLALTMGQGALGGACLGLYTSVDGSLIRIVGFILLGAVVGLLAYYRHYFMHSAWRE